MNLYNQWFGDSRKPNSINSPTSIYTYSDFWEWFTKHADTFLEVLNHSEQVEQSFFVPLSQELAKLDLPITFLAGKKDAHTADLVFTVDGALSHAVFVEELVASAPDMPHWNFIAHKPALGKEIELEIQGVRFGANNMQFYPKSIAKYPELIAIGIVHNDYSSDNEQLVEHGGLIFLENYLGELILMTQVDYIEFTEPKEVDSSKLQPLSNLSGYLQWCMAEQEEIAFPTWDDMPEEQFALFEKELEEKPFLAVVNTSLVDWAYKFSFPYVCHVFFEFQGNEVGMPQGQMYQLLGDIEDELIHLLSFEEGGIYLGRELFNHRKKILLATNDFRKSAKILQPMVEKYNTEQLKISYQIRKDMYWTCLNVYDV